MGRMIMENKKKNILIVGDSFIDENWLMSTFDVYHSYNVGAHHYTSILDSANYSVISLCGAVGIMRILSGSPKNGPNSKKTLSSTHNLIAVSAWNPRDDLLLPCILCEKIFKEKKEPPYIPYLFLQITL